MSDFDLAVVGGGPGGYVAAERAAARGLKTVLVEREHLGGVCLNSGCIPTKTLIHSAKLLQQARGSTAYGVTVDDARYDLGTAMAWKNTVTERLRGGVASQMERHGVTVERGTGVLTGRGRLAVDGREMGAANVIVATGSRAARPPIAGADLPHVVDSSGALQLQELPARVVIVGGGYIGMEFACYFHAVGCEVVVVEMLDDILAGVDTDIARQLKSALPGVVWHLGARVSAITASGVTLATSDGEHSEAADLVLLATGRTPNTDGLGLEAVGAVFNRRGVTVDEYLRTNVAGLYAVGDVTGRSLLAHAASRMGEVAVDAIAAPRPGSNRMRYHAVPWVVYTLPEIAGVGLSEAAARASGRNVRVARLPLAANGRFLAEHLAPASGAHAGPRGLVKVIVDADSHVLLGVHMIGTPASEIIFGAATMIEAELRVEELREIVFPHPTVSEALRDVLWEVQW
jgi:dihydrolipoamide dehydrogenase